MGENMGGNTHQFSYSRFMRVSAVRWLQCWILEHMLSRNLICHALRDNRSGLFAIYV